MNKEFIDSVLDQDLAEIEENLEPNETLTDYFISVLEHIRDHIDE